MKMLEAFSYYLVSDRIEPDLCGSAAGGESGAVVLFLGIVRGDAVEGRRVTAITYHAYELLAEREMRLLVLDVYERWPITNVVIRHRIGPVPVGEIALYVQVAAPHRAEAYHASQQIIERIKSEVPIWKQTHYKNGSSNWSPSKDSSKEISHAGL